jgi:dihydrolipoamide dehydrogenase
MRSVQKKVFQEMRFNTKVLKLETEGKKIAAVFGTDGSSSRKNFDRVLVAVGRSPNCRDLGLENAGVALDDKGFIRVNGRMETSVPSLYAIGDVVGGMLLAHKASREARIAVEALSGGSSTFDSVVPAVVFTDPEIAWCGLTETEAHKRGIQVKTARFSWQASGRALSLDRPDGLTKLLVDLVTERVLGVGIVGAGAGELIGEGVLAVEMGATARDLAETVHAHPTLSETLMECAESFYGMKTRV